MRSSDEIIHKSLCKRETREEISGKVGGVNENQDGVCNVR